MSALSQTGLAFPVSDVQLGPDRFQAPLYSYCSGVAGPQVCLALVDSHPTVPARSLIDVDTLLTLFRLSEPDT